LGLTRLDGVKAKGRFSRRYAAALGSLEEDIRAEMAIGYGYDPDQLVRCPAPPNPISNHPLLSWGEGGAPSAFAQRWRAG